MLSGKIKGRLVTATTRQMKTHGERTASARVTFAVVDGEVGFPSSLLSQVEEEAVPAERLVGIRGADGLNSLETRKQVRKLQGLDRLVTVENTSSANETLNCS